MHILLTGASGLIGIPTVRRLSQIHTVYALVRRPPVGPTMPGISWLTCDLACAWNTEGFPKHVDVVIHLAQSRRFREFPEAAPDIFAVNMTSTLLLLDYARQAGARQFIYASSGGIYGRSPHPFAESASLPSGAQLDFYLTTNLCAEVLVKQYGAYFVTTILRPFFVYGIHQHPQMLIPRLISSVREGRPIRLAGSAGIRINPIYALDCVEVLERCLALQESCTINVAGSEICTMRQIGEIIGDVVGQAAHFVVDPRVEGDLIGDIDQLVQLLGYRPRVSLQTGIAHICQNA